MLLNPLAPWLLLAAAEAAPANPSSPLVTILQNPLFPFVMIALLFYLLLVRPERRKRTEMARLLDNLKKNDRVVTIGGLYGTIVNVQKGSEEVTLRVDENNNTRVRVLRSAISRVLGEGEEKRDDAAGT